MFNVYRYCFIARSFILQSWRSSNSLGTNCIIRWIYIKKYIFITRKWFSFYNFRRTVDCMLKWNLNHYKVYELLLMYLKFLLYKLNYYSVLCHCTIIQRVISIFRYQIDQIGNTLKISHNSYIVIFPILNNNYDKTI